ncbi:MAG: hypothetical protein J6B01_07285 [Ruminococcus sp.]|nr:hypothetical protein [Ruminococcus sp.]
MMNENTVQNEQEITETSIEETEQPEESYSIYEFLKNDTSVLIAVISGLVAIILAFLKLGSYLYHTAYLNYWNIDSRLLTTQELYWLENIIFSFVFMISCVIYIGLLSESASTLKKCNYYKKYANKLIKKVNNQVKELKIQLSAAQDIEIKDNIAEEIKNIIFKIESVKKERGKIKLLARMQFIANAFFFSIVFGLIFYVTLLQYSNSSKDGIKITVLLIIFMSIFITISSYFTTVIDKQKMDDKCRSLFEENQKDVEIPMYPFRKLSKLGIKHYLSNKYIFKILFFMCVVLCSFLYIQSEQGKSYADKIGSKISITTIDETAYAIIAVDSDNIIAERIEINDKNAVVYVNEQIIIPKENIEMKVYTFENVTKDNT